MVNNKNDDMNWIAVRKGGGGWWEVIATDQLEDQLRRKVEQTLLERGIPDTSTVFIYERRAVARAEPKVIWA